MNKNDFSTKLGKVLKEVRKNKGWSIENVAGESNKYIGNVEKDGISTSSISAYECGSRGILFYNMYILSKCYGISLDSFVLSIDKTYASLVEGKRMYDKDTINHVLEKFEEINELLGFK